MDGDRVFCNSNDGEFGWVKRNAIRAAKDFDYGEEIIKQLKEAKSEGRIDTIMREARHKKWKD